MLSEAALRRVISSLWLRLATIAILSLVFYEGLYLARGEVQGWLYYLTGPEVAFEVLVRLAAAALAGLLLGTAASAAVAPMLWYFKTQRERIAEWTQKAAVIVAVFVVSRFALLVLVRSSVGSSSHIDAILTVSLVAFYVAFAVTLSIPRSREQLVTSLDGVSSEKMSRRTVLATVVGSAALVATEFALAKKAPAVLSAFVPQRTKSNFLLITFDALTAEDMSLYGYKLPTTPNIDAFARKATVFKNFYSASTFTTPCVATMLTGVYPSESHVYQLQGRLRAEYATQKNLPHLMGAAGYATGAFISNPFAYYFAKNVENGFDVLPDPRFEKGVLQSAWAVTGPLHQESRIGNRVVEYISLQRTLHSIGLLPTDASFRLEPSASFDQARQLIDQLSNDYFLWVHVMAPHAPYLPDAADHGRFIRDAELESVDEETEKRWQPRYESDQQSQVNRIRLRYDECIATADRAFGAFMSDLDSSGKLQNTTVVVSADHGESFEGGIYQHESSYQTRPVIHVPLIIRTPGQQDGRTVAVTADQTSLAPTIIELAGQRKPYWMRSKSLVEWLDRDGQGKGEGLAFTQDLETNSVFKPVRRGSVGVISGDFQYVVYLSEQRSNLRPLREAQVADLDRSAEYPAQAGELRAALRTQFPDLVR